jgi:Tfp pilus assembly protein PilN
MFTIDLLKGQCIPIKSGPEGIVVAAATFVVPVIVTIIALGCYLHTRIVTSIQQYGLITYENKINALSEAVELQESFEKEKIAYSSGLQEVAASIGRHTQWSPVLVELASNMPDSMIMTGLEVKQDSLRQTIPKKDDPQQMVSVSVPVRTLSMNVSGNSQYDCDKAVRDFRDRLRSSDSFGTKLENIRVSQKLDTLGGKDVVSYQIECIFKPDL